MFLKTNPQRRVFGVLLVFSVLIAGTQTSGTAHGADLKSTTSLGFVPSDASFYSTSLRTREQCERLINSNAFAKLKEMQIVNLGLFMAQTQWENNEQIAPFKAMLEMEENQQLVAMLKDAASHEIFFYGGDGFAPMIALASQLNSAQTTAGLEAATTGGDQNQIMVRKMIEILGQGDALAIPDSIIGFKLSDTAPATAQLKRLEQLGMGFTAQMPMLAGKFQRAKVGGGEYLTLTLDGSMIPFEEIPLDELGDARADAEKMIEKVKEMTLAISVGVYKDYLIVSFGSSTDHLARLGQGESLADRQELAAVAQHSDKPLTSIGYVSAEFAAAAGNVDGQLDSVAQMAEQFLPMAPINPRLQQELATDIKALMEEVKKQIPDPAATMGFSFMTDRGYEGYSHSFTKNEGLDGSKPLTILNHVGGNPLIFFAGRTKSSPEDFDHVVHLLSRAFYYGEQIGMENMGDDEREIYKRLRDEFMPFVKRLESATRQYLIPAFADGQGALVIDSKSTSTSWVNDLPPSETPLPMIEFGIVQGVSNAEQVKQGFSEYFATLQDALTKAHELSKGDFQDVFPEEIPVIQLPSPQSREFPSGTVYYYTLPADAGLHQDFAPNAGLSADMLVASLMPKFTKRLLDDTPLSLGGPLANTDRPLAAAGHFNFAGLVDTIVPWVEYGMNLYSGFDVSTAPQQPSMAEIKQGLEILKCFRGISTVTYVEGDVTITHSEIHFEDLK